MKARLEEAKLRDIQPPLRKDRPVTERIMPERYQFQGTTMDRDRKCFLCGQVGHFKKQCLQLQRGKSVEARGQNLRNAYDRASSRHVTSVGQDEELNQVQKRVALLKKELQEAELQKALALKIPITHVVEPRGEASDPVLGPTVYVEVLLEGQPVKALVDTGSPVTIASIDCILSILESLREPSQSPEEWKQEIQKRFSFTVTGNWLMILTFPPL